MKWYFKIKSPVLGDIPKHGPDWWEKLKKKKKKEN